jgi:hypothetical protein
MLRSNYGNQPFANSDGNVAGSGSAGLSSHQIASFLEGSDLNILEQFMLYPLENLPE